MTPSEIDFFKAQENSHKRETNEDTSNFIKRIKSQYQSEACRYCHRHNVLVRMTQKRSADEGMDANYTCTDCHKSWVTKG